MDNPAPPSDPPPVSPPSGPPPASAHSWEMWCHLSALAGFLIPFGNIIGPLVVWLMKRQQFPSVDAHGKESLNFQISVLIYLVVGGVAAFVGSFICVGWLLLPVLALIPLASVVLCIIAAIKANQGEAYRYPLTLRFIN